MRLRSSYCVVSLFILSVVAAQAQVTRTPAVGAQPPVITVTLGTDQTALVKTAQGITTRIAFPEKVTESICGDLYDPASGRGTFVVQNSGTDIFLKPVASKGVSNLFVMTGEGANRRIYHFDLSVVSLTQAHRVVNVISAPRSTVPAAQPPMESQGSGEARGLTLKEPSSKEPPSQIGTASSNPPPYTTSSVRNSDFDPAAEAPGSNIGATRPPEPPQPVKILTNTSEPNLEAVKKEQPKQEAPRIVRKSGGVVSGEPIRRAEPVYPQRAKTARISGSVVVEVTVDELGNVVAARPVSGHALLTDAAVDAARGWKFKPTKVSGQPVRVVRTITFNFSL